MTSAAVEGRVASPPKIETHPSSCTTMGNGLLTNSGTHFSKPAKMKTAKKNV